MPRPRSAVDYIAHAPRVTIDGDGGHTAHQLTLELEAEDVTARLEADSARGNGATSRALTPAPETGADEREARAGNAGQAWRSCAR